MILGAEIGITILGLITLFRGEYKVQKDKVLKGSRARTVGWVALGILPAALVFGFLFGFLYAAINNATPQELKNAAKYFFVIDIAIIILWCTILWALSNHLYKEQEAEESRYARQAGTTAGNSFDPPTSPVPSQPTTDPNNPFTSSETF